MPITESHGQDQFVVLSRRNAAKEGFFSSENYEVNNITKLYFDNDGNIIATGGVYQAR